MKKKAVVITHIPAPYQVAFAKSIHQHLDVEFWFMQSIADSTRPAYWEQELPDYCKILRTYLKKGQFFYCPDINHHMNRFQPDYLVLHGRWNNLSWYPAYKWAVNHKKKVLMGPFEMPTAQNGFKEMIRRILYRKIDGILCSGYKTLDYYRFKSKRVFLFGYAADIQRELEHPVRNPLETVTFLHSGSMNPRFRVHDIVDAIENAYSRVPTIRLVLSGNGPDRPSLENRIRSSAVLSSITQWIDVDSWQGVQDVYLHADVLISYPSYAGWGLTIPEAMASGMGIISGINVTSAREFIIPDHNGFFVDTKQELHDAILRYAKNPSLVNEHGRMNKKIAKQEGAEEKALRLFKILKELP
ncbi:MAG: glycosyltransferase [Caldisericia bacterium]|nr:glycosyltransferase [Caldisericia bacterium]MDD4614164.1 glycosyltransferase [Caldisericia bacterium]